MSLTKPKFVHPDRPKTADGPQGHRSIFDIDVYLDRSTTVPQTTKGKSDLRTSSPIFYGKEKPEEFNLSIFDPENYRTDLEDPGIFSITHFDEPIPNIESAYRSGSSTPASLISVGRFALSPTSSRRSSLFPEELTPDLAMHYIPGLQEPSMEPERKIDITEVRSILKESFEFLKDETYEVSRCRNLSKNLSDYILYQLKILDYERYKFTCVVNIGQNLGQDLRIASRSLWNEQTDTYVTEHFQNKDLFAVATVFAVYQE